MYVANLHCLLLTRTIGEHVQPTLVPAFFVCQIENLLLLRTSPPASAILPILPFKEFMITTTFEYVIEREREEEEGQVVK